MVVLNTVTDDGFTHRRADDLDTEAAYYRHRAIQEEQHWVLATTLTSFGAWQQARPH